jgi:hypothetical protein
VLGRAAAAGDQAQPQGQDRPAQPGLPGEQPLAGERAQEAVAVGGEAAERERRVDVGHLELQPAAPVVPGDPGPDPHLGAIGHAHRAAGVGEPGVDPPPGGVEQHHGQAGDRRPRQVAVGGGLDQVEPHGAAPPAGVEVADDPSHPDLVGEGGAHPEPDGLAQLGDRPGGVAGVVPQRGRARGGRHAWRAGRATGAAGRGTTSHTPSR